MDEFETQDCDTAAPAPKPPVVEDQDVALEDLMEKFTATLSGGGDDPAALNELLRMLNMGESEGDRPANFSEGVTAAVNRLGGNNDTDDNEFLDKLMKDFGKVDDQDPDQMDELLENMMKMMLTKETIRPPVAQLAGMYPAWIDEHEGALQPEELDVYRKQSQGFAEVLAMLDRHSGDEQLPPAIVDRLNEVQEYGNPPEELLSQLMPGLKFGQDGNLDGSEECTIM